MTTTLEVRCPVGPRKLLAKLQLAGEQPAIVSGNLIEFSCRDCAREMRFDDSTVKTVLHRFDILGELIESETVYG